MGKVWFTHVNILAIVNSVIIILILLIISSSADETPDIPIELSISSESPRSLHHVFPSKTDVIASVNETSNSEETDSEESVEEPDRIHHIKALINHTLTHGGEGDLDKLIFSSLPHGSKLVVQSVKVIPTDENGDGKESPVHWDVSIKNATDSDYPEDEDSDSAEVEEYDDQKEENNNNNTGVPAARESNIELIEHETDRNTSASTIPEKTANDLAIAGSHSQENYKSYGSSQRDKEVGKKHYHGTDHGKTHKVTDTDTDGKKKTNYHGKEDGVTDYANSHGKKQSNEGERFRDTKKKNKGRRVSGFKRVYHKEEFQRTEHFYDDEDAKRIAESFGQKDAKEQSSHGKKDDDRKYHGTRNEYLDGKKIKNEHGTSNGYNKGQLTEYKDSEKHKHGTHYNKAHDSSRAYPHNQNYHHPNHNYRGSYSNINKNTIRRPHSLNPALRNYISPPPTVADNHQMIESPKGIIAVVSKAPMTASFTVTEYLPQSSESSLHSSSDAATRPLRPSLEIHHERNPMRSKQTPNEIKMFYSPRDHQLTGASEITNNDNGNNYHHPQYQNNNQYHHNPFLLARHQMHHNLRQRNNRMRYGRTPFLNKIGNASVDDYDTNLFRNNYTTYYRNPNGTYDSERYARNYPTNVPTTNGLENSDSNKIRGYSTIIKNIPGVYINLTDDDTSSNSDSRQQSSNHPKHASHPGVNKYSQRLPMKVNEITFTTPIPAIYRRPPGGRWFSISFGDPDIFDEIHRPNGFSPPNRGRLNKPVVSLASAPQGHRTIPRRPYPHHRPPPTFVRGTFNRYDHSKYPPNVVHALHPAVQKYQVDASTSILNKTEALPKNVSTTRHEEKHETENGETDNSSSGDREHNIDLITNQSSSSAGPNFKTGPFQQYHRPKLNTAPFSKGNPPSPSRSRTPHSLPPFMNNLMDSVANFFSNVG